MPHSLLRPACQFGVMLLAGLLLAGLAGCPGGGNSGEAASGKTGKQIYADKRCGMCHGEQREGKPPLGPPLKGLAQHWTADALVNSYFPDPIGYQSRDPRLNEMLKEYNKMKMPPVTGDPADLRKLAEYLLTE